MRDRKGKNRLVFVVSWTAVFLWMAIIFYLSAQVATQSDELSQGIAEKLFSVIAKAFPWLSGEYIQANFIVRKSAHFLSYLMMGLLTMNALRRSGVKGLRLVAIAIVICVLYAISDEVHQLFVPGRSGQIKDVLIDSGGAIVGTVFHRLFERRG
ncbi:putative integral membrane protein [Desulfitobacterium dichloroeliminans LMG P-21439]|uniref:Putative integral membrane protein n=1 Tax=Desulfitobacterium dichloroeliminans (strain LMG P-21439 / DCA1) TaxID=871963 RepID=L0FC47_DESDL|nr:VanZ family protein [Desulfitobacterium dichloroeliminans]AGA70570.1 putative integral membrane protein [Desulfitobacterium dichloroeliminans LMG P-21439]